MIGYVLALAIGLSLGILGGGGSILTVPIFVYVMGYTAKQAIAMSLVVVGATSLVGAIRHWRVGNFDVRAAAVFGFLAMVGARLGAEVARVIPGIVQLALLGVVMLVAATLMLRRRDDSAARSPKGGGVFASAATAAVGLGVGLLTGLIGTGGGFLFVPALVLLARLPMKVAVGTSLFVITLSTAAGAFGYRGQVTVPWGVLALFTMIAIVGIFMGTWLLHYVSQQALRRAFAYFLFGMAGFVLYQNRAVIAHPFSALHPSSAGTR
ncbi:MAG TPA: sulfite exporter TauE/SafE family protein [Gemmatimonadaceae bacterium]|nr:sulfite exporter TauE/SafE family protein [Gemmatimonadaceae bacterium]